MPIVIKTKFKWLQNEPFFLDKQKKLLFIHAQVEGGLDWLGNEIECRDLFLVLKKDEKTEKYIEIQAKQLFNFDEQNVARISELVKSVRENDIIKLKVTEGTHNYFSNKDYICKVDENGISLKAI